MARSRRLTLNRKRLLWVDSGLWRPPLDFQLGNCDAGLNGQIQPDSAESSQSEGVQPAQ